MITAVNADATTTIAMTRDVHLISTDPIAVARPRTLAHDHLNVEEGTTGAMTDVMMIDVLLANTTHIAAASHAHQIHAGGNHTLVRDVQTRVLPLARTETEMADDARLLLLDREDLPRPDVVHHQAMNLTATAVPDLPETIEMIASPDPLGTTIVHRGRSALPLLIAKQNAWPN